MDFFFFLSFIKSVVFQFEFKVYLFFTFWYIKLCSVGSYNHV